MTGLLTPEHTRASDAAPLHPDPETARICSLLAEANRLPPRAWESLTPEWRRFSVAVRALLLDSLCRNGGFTADEIRIAAHFEARCLDVARAAFREALVIEVTIRDARARLAAALAMAERGAVRASADETAFERYRLRSLDNHWADDGGTA